jgi:hypothetical protein
LAGAGEQRHHFGEVDVRTDGARLLSMDEEFADRLIAAIAVGRVVLVLPEMVGDLALRGGLQHPLGQLLKQPAPPRSPMGRWKRFFWGGACRSGGLFGVLVGVWRGGLDRRSRCREGGL